MLRCRTVQTSACEHTEFVLDTYVKPVKLSMHQLPQTAVELPCMLIMWEANYATELGQPQPDFADRK